MNVDRLAQGYQPLFDIDAAVGRQGELFVHDIAEAMNNGRGEVKYDVKASQYKRVFVEFACLHHGEFAPSGIDVTAADYWSIVLGRETPSVAVTARTDLIRAVKDRAVREGMVRNNIRGSHPTNGAVIPLKELLLWLLHEADSVPRDVAA